MKNFEKQFNQQESLENRKKTKNHLLEGPDLVSPEEERNQKDEMNFSFFSDRRHYYFGHKDNRSFFMIEYFDSLPDELSEEEKEKFTKETRKQNGIEKVVYVFRHGEVPEVEEEIEELDPSQSKKYRVTQSRDFEREIIRNFIANDSNKQAMGEILTRHSKLNPEEISQIIEQTFEDSHKQDKEATLVFLNQFSKKIAERIRSEIEEKMLPKPQEMEVTQLVEILKNKKVLFYTGAGISEASGVLSMNQLQEILEIDEKSEKVNGLLKKAIANPQNVIESWEKFTKAAFEKPATPAHQSLKILAQKLKSQIFTENFDHLQERTGVKAVRLTGPWLKENIQPEWLKDINAVITIGLSYDDRGFLGWYKENNPNGKIIAVNLNQPSYLGNEDFILKGDCQKFIPELEKEFAEKE